MAIRSTKRRLASNRIWIHLSAAAVATTQLFSNAAHGNALSTFSRLVAGHGATVLAVEDTRGAVFGGYCPVPWQAQRPALG